MFFNIKGPVQAKAKVRAGLDIGSDSLKAVEITSSGSITRLSALGIKKISGHSSDALADSIKALAEEAKMSAKEVAISVSGPDVIVRFITMPKMKEDDLRSAIKFEAEKFIPFNISDCITDFQVLEKDSGENKTSVLLAVAKKAHVLERMKAVEQAGFAVSLVDVDGFALANSFLRNFPSIDASKSFALINIGARLTNLSILRGLSIYFTRDMVRGAADFMAAQALTGFMDEVRLSFSYYENQRGMGIDEIYISGGAANMAGLREAFTENFGSAPASWNPLQFLDAASLGLDAEFIEKQKHLFAISSGLALR